MSLCEEIDKKLYSYYINNCDKIDEMFYSHCFFEANFEFWDQKKMFNSESFFWDYVLDQYLKENNI